MLIKIYLDTVNLQHTKPLQAKHHVTKLIKFSSEYPSWKTLESSITATKILKSFKTKFLC